MEKRVMSRFRVLEWSNRLFEGRDETEFESQPGYQTNMKFGWKRRKCENSTKMTAEGLNINRETL
jgi:hypothetical protein